LLAQADPSLIHGGRIMGKDSEVFVAFDVAKKKHAVAIAEGRRAGEVRFLGDVENSPLPIERTIKRLAERYERLHVCFEVGPTGSYIDRPEST
jgi:transposase